jgi:predicted phosphodiesterase
VRVYAISDIHFDYDINACWVEELSLSYFQEDLLILAGDISHDIYRLRTCIQQLCQRFNRVLFVPGNHDLWVVRKEFDSSFDKFDRVIEVAVDAGASIEPYHDQHLSIVPLFSWYDYSFGLPCDNLRKVWVDFCACQWPQGMGVRDVNHYFLEKNQSHLDIKNEHVISFSHFLPRIDVMPDYIPPKHRVIYPVLGSDALDKQVRALNSNIHVYGHSHVNQQVRLNGIDYINNAFGSPSEAHFTNKDFLCIYEY